MICIPGTANSDLIIIDNDVPINALNVPNIKYNTPISLAFVEQSHLTIPGLVWNIDILPAIIYKGLLRILKINKNIKNIELKIVLMYVDNIYYAL